MSSPFRKLMQEALEAGTYEAIGDEIPYPVIQALEDAEDIIAELLVVKEAAKALAGECNGETCGCDHSVGMLCVSAQLHAAIAKAERATT